jgi:signal recognition particle subunit SRP54
MSLRRLTGKAYLNENDIDEMMKEIRLSLLEADVAFSVVKTFTANIKNLAYGEKILKGLNPGEQVVKIVKDELIRAFGGENVPLNLKNTGLSVIMMIGLQGSGKTTSIGKLGKYLTSVLHKKVMFVACDIYRPAAIEQLETIAKKLEIFVYQEGLTDPIKTVKNSLIYAKNNDFNCVIIDTAGRLSIDELMIDELIKIKELSKPDEILLTIDAMTGQDAAITAKNFHEKVGATGAIITKLDGDTRGGAALSVNQVANIPIKFTGSGETLDTLEVFHPERMAQRILGMGDILSLVETVEQNIDEAEALNMMEKIQSGKYNYEDLLKQFKWVKRMGSFSKILGFLPGMGNLKDAAANIDDKQFNQFEAIINSMTKAERKHPNLLEESYSRRSRVAKGSGVGLDKVNKLREALTSQVKMMRQMSSMDENQIKALGNNPTSMMRNIAPNKTKSKGKGKNKHHGFR